MKLCRLSETSESLDFLKEIQLSNNEPTFLLVYLFNIPIIIHLRHLRFLLLIILLFHQFYIIYILLLLCIVLIFFFFLSFYHNPSYYYSPFLLLLLLLLPVGNHITNLHLSFRQVVSIYTPTELLLYFHYFA